MNYFTIRLKRHPNLYVRGKPYYSIKSDSYIRKVLNNPSEFNYGRLPTVDSVLQIDAY
jgi:hypothetical protein